MKFLPIRNPTLLATALLLLTSFPYALAGIQNAGEQDEARLERLHIKLGKGSDEERRQAVMELATIKSEKASQLLLNTLKKNMADKRGNIVRYGTIDTADSILWTYSPSENLLLVEALGSRRYQKALPTLRKLLKVNEKWLGFSRRAVAESIYLISSEPVKYTEDGEVKNYPEPKEETDPNTIFASLRLPAAGEAAWEERSLNNRVRELVRVLGSSGGPQGYRDPYFKTLKEEIGLPTLLKLAKEGDPLVRPYAVEALAILGENASEVIPLLTTTARDDDPRVRFRSVRGLGHFLGANNKPEDINIVISALTKALSDAEPEVRQVAAETFALNPISHDSSISTLTEAVALLVSTLGDKSGDLRAGAAFALSRIGPLTDQVVPSLIRLLHSRERIDRQAAAQALSSILENNKFRQSKERPRLKKEIGRALINSAGDPANGVRYAVAEGLGEIGPVERGVVSTLIKLTKDQSRGVRTAAASSLGGFETDRRRIVATLAKMLEVEDEDAQVIDVTLIALGKIGPDARSVAPQVRKLLKSKYPRTREEAGYALEKIESRPSQPGK